MKKTTVKRSSWILAAGIVLLLSTIILIPISSQAQTNRYWVGGIGNWSFGDNWNTDPGGSGSSGVPLAGDSAFLNQPVVTVNYISGTNPTLFYVEVDDTSGSGYGSYLTQAQDTLTTDYMRVGNSAFGYYSLSGTGSLVVNYNLTIGVSAGSSGDVFQGGGNVSISGGSGALTLGRDAGAFGSYTLDGGILVGSEEYIGDAGSGFFYQGGGSHVLNGMMYLGVQATGYGYYSMTDGTLTAGAGGGGIVLGEWGTGEFSQTGGLVAVNDITIGTSGTYNYSGGTLSPGSITNQGNFKLSGTGTRVVNGNVTNNAAGKLEIYLTQANFLGPDVTNWGTIKVTGSTVTWPTNFYQNGAYNSDPSINIFTNLIIGPTGYLTGGLGDEFYIGGDFLNNSQNGLWNTHLADLFFTGAGPHMFHLSNLDVANTWDELSLLNGAILDLSSDAASTLFIRMLNGEINNIINTGLYTLTINYNGTELTLQPVPLPSTLLLLGSGLIGLAGLMRRRLKKN